MVFCLFSDRQVSLCFEKPVLVIVGVCQQIVRQVIPQVGSRNMSEICTVWYAYKLCIFQGDGNFSGTVPDIRQKYAQ